MSEQEKDSFDLIDASADLIGSLAGASVVALHNDVAGLLTGAAVVPGIAHTLRYGAKLFVNRILAGREKARVGLVYGLAAHRIKERLDRGDQLRTDGFFEADITNRSSADEIAEAILIAAQKEYEERKLPYIANLLEFVVFTPEIDRAMANHMVRTASTLSYRQFRILALANDPRRRTLNPAQYYPLGAQSAPALLALLYEMFDLYQSQLIEFPGRQE